MDSNNILYYVILIWKFNKKKLISTIIPYLFTMRIISLFILSLISNKSNNDNILIIHWKQSIQLRDVFQRYKKHDADNFLKKDLLLNTSIRKLNVLCSFVGIH